MKLALSNRLQANFEEAEKIITAIKAGQITVKEADTANRELARDMKEIEKELKLR